MMKLVVLVALVAVATALPNARRFRNTAWPRDHDAQIAENVMANVDRNARLLDISGSDPITAEELKSRLISNYTVIRAEADIVGGFTCSDKNHGYYADVNNGCQIFHVCVMYRNIYPNDPLYEDLWIDFSMICNSQTIFSQDSLTCMYETEAVPCSLAPELYFLNAERFFPPQNATQPRSGFGRRTN